MTKKYRLRRLLFSFLSFLAVWAPAIIFTLRAFITGEAHTTSGFTLGAACIVSVLLCAVSAVCKYHWRTPAVIILLALYTFANNFGIVLITVGIGIMLDELIFTPIAKHYKNLYIINKEIDKR